MRHWAAKAIALALAAAAMTAWGAEATFERDLTVNGRVELTVQTGSGSIQLRQGASGHVHILGRVRSSWGANDDKVREIADHPPVEQTGNIVRVGAQHQNLHNISIDYEIEAPADAFLTAQSGSGNVNDEGVGADAKLSTGSGGIHATGLRGAPSLDTGSGNIYAELTGDGDPHAQTGSGSIELHGVHGALKAETGSGNIKVEGKPLGPWKLTTGSGSVELWTGDAAFTLDAQTGSGSVHSDREMLTQGTTEHHHVTGKIGGGGPLVKIETGSGSIKVH
jgi:Putative adhesin